MPTAEAQWLTRMEQLQQQQQRRPFSSRHVEIGREVWQLQQNDANNCEVHWSAAGTTRQERVNFLPLPCRVLVAPLIPGQSVWVASREVEQMGKFLLWRSSAWDLSGDLFLKGGGGGSSKYYAELENLREEICEKTCAENLLEEQILLSSDALMPLTTCTTHTDVSSVFSAPSAGEQRADQIQIFVSGFSQGHWLYINLKTHESGFHLQGETNCFKDSIKSFERFNRKRGRKKARSSEHTSLVARY